MDHLQADGLVTICDCVSKENIPSRKTRLKRGFTIADGPGFDYLQDTYDDDNDQMKRKLAVKSNQFRYISAPYDIGGHEMEHAKHSFSKEDRIKLICFCSGVWMPAVAVSV